VKVFLLHRDRDFDVKPELRDSIFEAMQSGNPFAIQNARRDLERAQREEVSASPPTRDDALAEDLELDTLWRAMGGGDEFLLEVARRGVLSSLRDPDAILYRQQVLADCLEHRDVVRRIYELALEALDSQREIGGMWLASRPDTILSRSVQLLRRYVEVLRRLRQVAEEESGSFRSEGFGRFFAMLREELADSYLETVERHLGELEFDRGVLESAELGEGFKGRRYVVRRPHELHWTEKVPLVGRSQGYGFVVPSRDESGLRALEEIRARGINLVANAVGRSAEHVKSFFSVLRIELAFYLGCSNLHDVLAAKGEPLSFPVPREPGQTTLTAEGLYDVCLALHLDGRAVGNEVDAVARPLIVITGANQGGKSTFLRSVGVAQLMMQCGMFVGAESFRANVCAGVFTHFKREEDAAMERGKLDEELARMSEIADEIGSHGLLLCNESFASTNEREGSEIARQVVDAMLAARVKVVFVTHMYDLAHSLHERGMHTAVFLRAVRNPDGSRPFRLREGEPLPTSCAADTFRRLFGSDLPASVAMH
jgi:MutS domain V